MTSRRARAPWQPGEGSRLWGYLLPMAIGLPVVLVWVPVVAGMSWESGVLLGGVVTFAVITVAWLLFLRSTTADDG